MAEREALFWHLLIAPLYGVLSKSVLSEGKELPIALKTTAVYKRVYSVEILRMHYYKKQNQQKVTIQTTI